MAYTKLLSYVLNHRALFIVFLILLLIVFCLQFGSLGFSLMPSSNTNDSVAVSLTMREGTIKDVTLAKLFEAEEAFEEILPEGSYESISLRLDSAGNSGSITISLPDITEQQYSALDVQNLIRPLVLSTPTETWVFSAGRNFTVSSAVDVEITSEDPDLIESVASEIVSIFREHTTALRDIESDASTGSPELTVLIDYEKAKELGISISEVQSALYGAITGIEATELATFDSSSTYSLLVTLDDSISTIEDVESLMLRGSGGLIRLDQIAEFEYGVSPKSIRREDRVTINHVTASAAEGYSADEVSQIAEELLDQYLIVPDGVNINIAGEMADYAGYLETMIKAVLLALLLVYIVMAAQFESLIDPFIIFATIPLLLIGVIAIHLIMGQSFSLFSLIGVIALIGVVVNNGIVLVDSINRYVESKIKVRDACLLAAKNRLRPILMTTLTTVLGMVPLAFFPGEGSEMLQPIALTFLGGILTGSFLTLFLTPTLYSILNKRREKRFEDPDSLSNQLLEYDKWRATHIEQDEMPPESTT